MRATMGQLLINEALPEDLRDYSRVMTKAKVKELLAKLADNPDQYKKTIFDLFQAGARVAHRDGASISMRDLAPSKAKAPIVEKFRAAMDEIQSNPNLTDQQKEEMVIDITMKLQPLLGRAVYDEALKSGNRLAKFAESGVRGGPSQVQQMLGAPVIVTDHKGRAVPFPILNSFAEGLDPAEYYATTSGVRKGYVDLKQCLHEDTEVRMADGSTKRIADITPGEYVVGADRVGVLAPVKVLDVFDNGERECYAYVFRAGRGKKFKTLIATEDHNVLATYRAGHGTYKDRSVYAPTPLPLSKAATYSKPTKNMYVAARSHGFAPDSYSKHEPDAMLLGLLLGDGCTVGRTYSLSCGDPTLIDDIQDVLASAGVSLTPPSSGYSWIVKYADYDADNHGSTGRNPLVEKCVSYGMDNKYAHQKTLPEDIWIWDDESICAFLAGLFAADGCVEVNKFGSIVVKINLTAEAVVRGVSDLLEYRLGILTSPVRLIPVESIPCGNHDQFIVSVSTREDVIRFAELIHMPGIKGRTLAKCIASGSKPDFRNSDIGYKSWEKALVGAAKTFDLHVDNDDHLFMLANGLIVANSTPRAGYFSKQLANAAHRLIVGNRRPMRGTGLPVDTDDPDNDGSVLAQDIGPYKEGTVLTPKILKDLKKRRKRILVHSPVSAISPGGAVPQWAVGVREKGGLHPYGENVGVAAAQSIAEPLAQSKISSKHTAGVVGATGKGGSGGLDVFDTVEQLANIPRHFPGGATLAERDGIVTGVSKAPQGGYYVEIGDEKHYVDIDSALSVKVGDQVEAGDALSDGLPNPADVVRLRGIGEGRRYMAQKLKELLPSAHRRNVEILSRGMIDHVELEDEIYPGALPGDIVSYDDLAERYTPRKDSSLTELKKATNQYLEAPVLHYSIGTRVTPSVAKELKEFGIDSVIAHAEPPKFKPSMQRIAESMSKDRDWQVQLGGTGLKKNFLQSAHRGATSNIHGTSFVPALAQGTEFGRADEWPY